MSDNALNELEALDGVPELPRMTTAGRSSVLPRTSVKLDIDGDLRFTSGDFDELSVGRNLGSAGQDPFAGVWVGETLLILALNEHGVIPRPPMCAEVTSAPLERVIEEVSNKLR